MQIVTIAANSEAEREFDRIESRLAHYYSPFERTIWWGSPHPMLNGERAMDVLRAGRQAEIDRLIDRLDEV